MAAYTIALPGPIARLGWNIKYALLGYSQPQAPADVVNRLLRSADQSFSILDLGCGNGNLLRSMRAGGWQGYYCGVDVADAAVSTAEKIRDQRSAWVVSTIQDITSPFCWDFIVLTESIYYVPLFAIPETLTRLEAMLVPGGEIIVRIHDFVRHEAYVEALSMFGFERTSETLLSLCP